MEEFRQALELLPIGMGTVFAVLLLVMLIGRVIIAVSNKFPDQQLDKSVHLQVSNAASIPADHLVALVAAVHEVSQGQASIEEIERLDS